MGSRKMASLAGGAFIAMTAATGMAATQMAWADDVECYGSVSDDKLGEAMVSIMLAEGTGKQTDITASWTAERQEGQGTESAIFSRPQLVLDYKLNGETLDGPIAAETSITKEGAGPPLKELKVRVTGAQPEPLTFEFGDQSRGRSVLAKLIRENKPGKLTIEILDKSGKVQSSAFFDVSKTDKAQELLVKARADADRRVALYRDLVAKGTAGKSCPR